ncbi:TauD/TfdA family dioxygenase [uncultured Pseudacidovorax sp.]|uniref:TauD/TfdA dioxygenase family protein n=1 Tax=uncultured Pseudacidovorax sp. TaxID=679313 RepID=UPI0025FDDF31|nr:TauD/TfdA family dioxygenase [uncultured Pseudacidovorax sp.]
MPAHPNPIRIEPVDIAGRYRHIRPQPQQPNFAAHIEGVDLTQPIGPEVRRELQQALLDFEVLFFPPQPLTPEQHVALAAVFGELAPGAFFPRKDGHPFVEVIEFDEKRPPEINIWHSDLTWLPQPPNGTVIQITELPALGGNTAWASLSKAFAALSPGLQAYLEGLTATHTWEISGWRQALEKYAGLQGVADALRKYPPVSRPVVQVHPESGRKVLFVNENFTRHIDGVHFREGRGLLEFLREWIVQPEFVYQHKWAPHGIAVWDNRSTQHYALTDYWPHRRVTQRVTFNAFGTAPATQTTRAAVVDEATATA